MTFLDALILSAYIVAACSWGLAVIVSYGWWIDADPATDPLANLFTPSVGTGNMPGPDITPTPV